MRKWILATALLGAGALVCGPVLVRAQSQAVTPVQNQSVNGFFLMLRDAATGIASAITSANPLPVVVVSGGSSGSAALAPVAPSATTVVAGGTAVTVFAAGAVSSCQVTNPSAATENLILSAYAAPGTTGGGTSRTLVPGQSWSCPGALTTAISVNAATSGHGFEAEGFK